MRTAILRLSNPVAKKVERNCDRGVSHQIWRSTTVVRIFRTKNRISKRGVVNPEESGWSLEGARGGCNGGVLTEPRRN